jgi:hypothetical protein
MVADRSKDICEEPSRAMIVAGVRALDSWFQEDEIYISEEEAVRQIWQAMYSERFTAYKSPRKRVGRMILMERPGTDDKIIV